MPFTDALDVDVGDPTMASQYDNLADNPEWLRSLLEADHDFDISTGTGYHHCATDAPLHLVDANGDVLSLAIHIAADGGKWLIGRDGTYSAVSQANADFYIELNGATDDIEA